MTEPKVYFDEPLNNPPEIPPELDRWNWGAFLLNWIWGIGNSVWIALLMFVPLVNIVMVFILGARGSRLAWKNRAWRDAEHFRKVQRRWAIAGFLVVLLSIAAGVGLVFGTMAIMRSSDAYQMTLDAARSDPRVAQALGDDFSASSFFTGGVSTNGDGTGGAGFNIPVSGSKGSGTIFSQLHRDADVWKIDRLAVTIDGQEPIVIVEDGQEALPGTST
ncbi:cytochrome c oxidase assembly factor Coa1 family protein [Tianweitania populi]|uniref:Cytochrome oxidase complex assembly protein 1 n=1 Tax=Tianweitania populi TaxID=1607949 RepID=A0A8J3GK00_9HYPH|nr:cytochrome c oxidase assembly factor Coa1 family protein [Tianweitania populi]GHD10427.1 hypothetical protein GCM10016234_12280 [Tianweitania populi]